MATTNKFLQFRNTYYWDQQGCAYAYGDYTKARIYHWLHSTDMNSPVGILESTKAPLEGRVWYDYAGQTTTPGPSTSGPPVNPPTSGGYSMTAPPSSTTASTTTSATSPQRSTRSGVPSPTPTRPTASTCWKRGKPARDKANWYTSSPTTPSISRGRPPTRPVRPPASPTPPVGRSKAQPTRWATQTTYHYDTNGYLRAITGPLSATDTTTFTYDAFGRIQTVTDNSGYTLTYDYDAADRLTTITFPDATTVQFAYILLDLSTVTDRAGRQTRFEYNNVRQPIQQTDPLGRITLFEWCKCGALRRLADPMGRTTTWRHDIQGRLTCKEYPDGSQVTYLYEDTTSRLEQRIDETLQITQYNYNRDDTLARISYTNAAVATAPVTFTYDADYNRITSMTDGTGTTRYGYIPITAQPALGAGQLETIDGPLPNATITYGYDELGRRTSTDINGTRSSVILDAAGRVTSETNALGTFTYTYDGNSLRETSQTCPNGLATIRSYGTNLQDFHLQQITNQNGTTPISQFIYGYDQPRGLITSWSQQADAQTPSVYSLGYDDADQLNLATVAQGATTTQTFGYTYDPAGNRLSEQISATVTHLSYNALNELTASDAPGSAATTYQWDPEHRLVKATSGTQTTELTYDGWGRCTAIVQSTSATPTSKRAFLWAGGQIAEEYAPDGTVSKRFFGQGAQILTGTAPGNYYYTRDHLGSIRELTDNTGTIQARYSYDPYGRPTQLTGDLDADFGFAGMLWSSELSLNLTWFRAYDPNLGRWLSRDPLLNRISGTPNEVLQGPNLYSYVHNNPIHYVDLDGRGELWDALWGVGPIDAFQAWLSSRASITRAELSGLPDIQYGPADAFRHAYWNCLMTRDIGADQAKIIADNHEIYGPGLTPATLMDYHNNAVGRTCTGDCDTCVQGKLDAGQLYVLVPPTRTGKLTFSKKTPRTGPRSEPVDNRRMLGGGIGHLKP